MIGYISRGQDPGARVEEVGPADEEEVGASIILASKIWFSSHPREFPSFECAWILVHAN
jgi:hypothetical protein